jgi:LuxR family maltose regulon positive regulatory protein
MVRKRGYTALARLRAIQHDRAAMLETIATLAEFWPEDIQEIQALHHRLSMRHWPDDAEVSKVAAIWLTQAGISFADLKVIEGVDSTHTADFEKYLNAAHIVVRLAQAKPDAYPLDAARVYLKRQQGYATSHGFVSEVVAIGIATALLYQAAGKKVEALDTLDAALHVAAPTGFLRIFVDEGEPLRALLQELKPRLIGKALIAGGSQTIDYTNRLLEALSSEAKQLIPGNDHTLLLSERELEVLRYLAKGLTYEEIGRHCFLSLNTIQFHVKNIYSKLLVNKRTQAIEKAREMHLI